METCLDSSTIHDDWRLNLNGYKLNSAGNGSNNKRGAVCPYFKEFLVFYNVDTQYMNECIIFKVSLKNKKGYFVSLYRSPSESHNDFEDLLIKLISFYLIL